MDEILKAMISQGGLASLMLAAVISYLLRKEFSFAQERKEFNALLETRNGEIHAILKEAVAFQAEIKLLLVETNKDHSELLTKMDELRGRVPTSRQGKQVT